MTIHIPSIHLENDEYPDENYEHNDDVDSADEQTDFSDDSENVSYNYNYSHLFLIKLLNLSV